MKSVSYSQHKNLIWKGSLLIAAHNIPERKIPDDDGNADPRAHRKAGGPDDRQHAGHFILQYGGHIFCRQDRNQRDRRSGGRVPCHGGHPGARLFLRARFRQLYLKKTGSTGK